MDLKVFMMIILFILCVSTLAMVAVLTRLDMKVMQKSSANQPPPKASISFNLPWQPKGGANSFIPPPPELVAPPPATTGSAQ